MQLSKSRMNMNVVKKNYSGSVDSYCKNCELTKGRLHYMKDRETAQNMIGLIKELNATLSFIK